MDKIIVPFNSIRALGDIVSPKSTTDFNVNMGDLTSATGTVNNVPSTVYSLSGDFTGLFLVVSKGYVAKTDTVTLTATLYDEDGLPVEDANVKFYYEVVE